MCTASGQRRVPPLKLAWERGSATIGDFVWAGFGEEVVVTDEVGITLVDRFSGIDLGPVEFVEDPGERRTARSRNVVTLPYQGPVLHELWPSRWVHIDRGRSTAELERTCPECGTEFWEYYGIERRTSRFDPVLGALVTSREERRPGAGLFVREVDLDGAHIFRVHEAPGSVFCVDAVRELVLERGWTNVDFHEMGETF